MKVTGTVKHKLAVQEGDTWKRQTLVLECKSGEYSNDLAIDFFGDDKIDLITGLKKNQEVTVHLNLKSREYNGKWYTNVNGWKVEAGEAKAEEPVREAVDASDDLPF
jgi:hypothetical protein